MGAKGLWLLSYNFCPETVDLYSKPGLYIEKLERPNNMAQKYDPGSMYAEPVAVGQPVPPLEKEAPELAVRIFPVPHSKSKLRATANVNIAV